MKLNKTLAFEIASRAPDVHPFCVAAACLCEGGGEDEFVVALLHDSLEDGYSAEDEIVDRFPVRIYEAVFALTRMFPEAYPAYIKRVSESSELAIFVKRVDARINLERCLADGDARRARRYAHALEILG